jgi:hypothetical protein
VATSSGTDDIVRLDADLNELSWPGLPILPGGKTRLLDFAWDRALQRFWGLFVGAEPNTAEITPFVMGGGAMPAFIAPFALSTLSTFAP